MSNSTALASLTATYTDSEGEEDTNDDEIDYDNLPDECACLGLNSSINSENRSTTSSAPTSPLSVPVRVTTRVAKLVSYHDDTIASDEENENDLSMPHHEVIFISNENHIADEEMLEEDGVVIPPEPAGHCSVDLQDKIAKYYEKMKHEQLDMNAFIEKRKDFRNPSIYEKLLQFCAINELGTNYPPSVYDPLKWNKESYYDELAKVQKAEIEKREKDRKIKEPGLKKVEDDSKKRKSKWDQPGGNAQNVKPAGLVQPPSLTTNATGTKSTVISAFGSLPKKPRA